MKLGKGQAMLGVMMEEFLAKSRTPQADVSSLRWWLTELSAAVNRALSQAAVEADLEPGWWDKLEE